MKQSNMNGMAGSIAPFDLEATLRRLQGDTELLIALTEVFLHDSPPLWTALARAIDSGNPVAVEKAAHALRGLAANFGPAPLVDQLFHIEELGRGGDAGQCASLVDEAKLEYDRLLDALRHYASL